MQECKRLWSHPSCKKEGGSVNRREGRTIRGIRDAVCKGHLRSPLAHET